MSPLSPRGRKALVAGQLKKIFFAASLSYRSYLILEPARPAEILFAHRSDLVIQRYQQLRSAQNMSIYSKHRTEKN